MSEICPLFSHFLLSPKVEPKKKVEPVIEFFYLTTLVSSLKTD